MIEPMSETPNQCKRGNWSIWQLFLWYTVYWSAWLVFKIIYRYRIIGLKNIPRQGPVLFVSNHQSYLDPLLIGVGSRPRPFISLARKTLFRNPYFGWLIRTLRAIPVDQESSSDLTSMRNCMEVLKGGDALLVFAEGSRTYTGYVNAFANGVAVLMKRADPIIVPVALEGAFDVWPRMNRKPKLWGRVSIQFGTARKASEILTGPVPQCMETLRQEVEQMRQSMREDMKLPALPAKHEDDDPQATETASPK